VEKMANRALLHMNKLKDFESWLEKQGYMILPTSKNPYEILRAKKDKDTVIIYQKSDSKEHLSIMDKDHTLIHKFIMESKPKTNADRIRNMSDYDLGDLLQSISSGAGNGSPFISLCIDDNEITMNFSDIYEWLQSEAE
jgi:hypothetical protein